MNDTLRNNGTGSILAEKNLIGKNIKFPNMDFVVRLLSKCIIVINVIGIPTFFVTLVLLTLITVVIVRAIIRDVRQVAEQQD